MESRFRPYTWCLALVLAVGIPTFAQQPPADQPDITIDESANANTVHALARDLREQYVFPEVAEKLAAMVSAHLEQGDYASVHSAKEFGELLTRQMREVAHDAHLQVIYAYAMPPLPATQGQPNPRLLRMMRQSNFGFEAAKILNGNVGYLRVTSFADPEAGSETVAGAMSFLADTDGLIIDLRENHGGNPGMVALLASYFFAGDQPVHLTDLSIRKPGTTEFSVQPGWTLPHVAGKKYLGKELYILTSHETPSAAEAFAYDMKVLKRARIVGETTWGGANPGKGVYLTDHFLAFIPFGQAINPITKTNWEGKGVQPDIEAARADALKVAYVAALEHLMKSLSDEQERRSLEAAIQKADTETK